MANAKKTLMSLIKSKKEEMPLNEAFLNDLKTVIMQLNPPRKPSKTYKPSSMNCARNMYFQIVGAEVDSSVTDPFLSRICECGTDSHERIQNYVSKMQECGIDCEWVDPEQYIKDKGLTHIKVTGKRGFETHCYIESLNISFMCDGIIRYRGKYFIFEIKTEPDNKGLTREEADPKHRRQSICYSIGFNIDDILWYYEERNYCIPKTFITHISNEDKDEIIGLIQYVDNCVVSQSPPPKTDQKRLCTYCNYKSECKKW